MTYCAAINCKSKMGGAPEKTFHRFPTWNPALSEVWVSKLGSGPLWQPSPFSVLCSDHFEESCFDTIGDVRHIRADAVPTLFFTDDMQVNQTSKETVENPQIISVISLDNLFKSLNEGTDPLRVFHDKIDEICNQKITQEKKKIAMQMLLSLKRFAINQQRIKIVLNRQRLLRRKMIQTAMIMILLTQQGLKINR